MTMFPGHLVLRGIGLGSPTYDLAKQVVAALDEGDYWSATALMGGLSPAELLDVTNKSIALGADPDVVRSIVKTLGQTEVINVIDTVNAISRPFPTWAKVALAVGGVGAAAFAYKKWRR